VKTGSCWPKSAMAAHGGKSWLVSKGGGEDDVRTVFPRVGAGSNREECRRREYNFHLIKF